MGVQKLSAMQHSHKSVSESVSDDVSRPEYVAAIGTATMKHDSAGLATKSFGNHTVVCSYCGASRPVGTDICAMCGASQIECRRWRRRNDPHWRALLRRMWWCYALWILEPIVRVTFVQWMVVLTLDPSASASLKRVIESLETYQRGVILALFFLPSVLLDLSARRLPMWGQHRLRVLSKIPVATSACVVSLIGASRGFEDDAEISVFLCALCLIAVLGAFALAATTRQLDRWTRRDLCASGRSGGESRISMMISEYPWLRIALVGGALVLLGGGQLNWIRIATLAVVFVEYRALLLAFRRWIRA